MAIVATTNTEAASPQKTIAVASFNSLFLCTPTTLTFVDQTHPRVCGLPVTTYAFYQQYNSNYCDMHFLPTNNHHSCIFENLFPYVHKSHGFLLTSSSCLCPACHTPRFLLWNGRYPGNGRNPLKGFGPLRFWCLCRLWGRRRGLSRSTGPSRGPCWGTSRGTKSTWRSNRQGSFLLTWSRKREQSSRGNEVTV